MWHLSPGQDITLWKKELEHTWEDFQTPTLTLKRKAEHFDEMVEHLFGSERKRVHLSFGAAAAPASA